MLGSPTASGAGAVAIGDNASAQGQWSMAFGEGATALGQQSLAIGNDNSVGVLGLGGGIAVGSGNGVQYGVAVGTSNSLSGGYAFGSGNNVYTDSLAVGESNSIDDSSTTSLAQGFVNELYRTSYSNIYGSYNYLADGTQLNVFGYNNTFNTVPTSNNNVFGSLNDIQVGNGLSLVGSSNSVLAAGEDNMIIGSRNLLDGNARNSNAVFGTNNVVKALDSNMILGTNNAVDGSKFMYVFGHNNTANSGENLVIGINNQALAGGAYIFGSNITNTLGSSIDLGYSDITKLTIDGAGRLTFRGSLNSSGSDGNMGDVLVSQGAGLAPMWSSASSLSSSIPVNNGLTNNLGTLQLGGPLVKNTVITSAANTLFIDESLISTQTGVTMAANQLTTGTVLDVLASNNSNNSANGIFRVANTGLSTSGILARFQANSTARSGMTILANGSVGINTTSPTYKFHIVSEQADFTAGNYGMINQLSASTNFGSRFAFYKSRGTSIAPTAILANDVIGTMQNFGYDGTGYFNAGAFNYDAAEAWTATAHGTTLRITTVANGTTALAERMRITNAGNVGIGNATPGYLLHVGAASLASGTTVARFQNAGGTCDVTPNVAGGVTCTSDVTLKKDITDVPYASSVLDLLDGVDVKSYHMLADDTTAVKQTGFVAQNLQTIFPSVVQTDSNGKLAVSYGAMTPILTLGVQQLHSKTAALESRISTLETRALTQAAWSGGVVALDTTFNGSVAFSGPVRFTSDSTFVGHVSVGSDTAGRIIIPAGQTTVHVAFSRAYAGLPVVTLTMQDSYDIPHKLHNVTKNGFDIDIQTAQATDVIFNWVALGT